MAMQIFSYRGDCMPSEVNLKRLLSLNKLDEIVKLGQKDNSVIKHLNLFLHDLNSFISWRAIEALGLIYGDLSQEKPELVRDIIRKLLHTLKEESGGAPWAAAQLIGEIIRNNPQEYKDFVSDLALFLEDENIKGYALWALGRIAEKEPDLIEKFIPDIAKYLDKNNPSQLRGFAAFALSNINKPHGNIFLKTLKNDDSLCEIYLDGELQNMYLYEFCC